MHGAVEFLVVALALGAGGEEELAHRGGQPHAVGGHVALDELHGVVDGHAGRHRAAGRVDVKGDIALGVLGGVDLGDTWRHPLIGGEGPSAGLVPFHKLSQWLTYSLIEPLQWAGIAVVDGGETLVAKKAGKLANLTAELAEKARTRPAGSGTVAALDAGTHAIGKKVVEEAAEVWMAAEHEGRERTAEEISQLLYHLQVLMIANDLDLADVYTHL